MKRFLPVVLGAVIGGIVMVNSIEVCDSTVRSLFTRFFNGSSAGVTPSWAELVMFPCGAVLGALSVGLSLCLCTGKNSFGWRLASVLCSFGGVVLCAWRLELENQFGCSMDFIASEAARCAPLLLWSLALFFFAILAR